MANVVRWTLEEAVIAKVHQVAKTRKIRVTQLVAHLINKEFAATYDEDEPTPPWETTEYEKDQAYGAKYKRYIGKPGNKKYSLAWCVADDPEFMESTREYSAMNMSIETSRLSVEVDQYKKRHPEVTYPSTDTTITQLIAVLISRGHIEKKKRGVYRMISQWEIDMASAAADTDKEAAAAAKALMIEPCYEYDMEPGYTRPALTLPPRTVIPYNLAHPHYNPSDPEGDFVADFYYEDYPELERQEER